MTQAPEDDCYQRRENNEILHSIQLVLHRAYCHNCRPLSGLECDEKQDPNEQDGYDADGEGNEEPDSPRWAWMHVLECDDVLR